MDEADVLAEMFGRKPQQPAPAPVAPASAAGAAPAPAAKSLAAYGLVAGGLVLSAVWVTASVMGVDWMVSHDWLALGEAGTDAIANLIVFGGLAALALLFMRLQPLPAARPAMAPGAAAALGFGAGIAGFLAAQLQIWAGHHLVAGRGANGAGAGLLVLGTAMVLFQASAEELLFRGWLQARLARLTGPTGAVAIAAFAFALLHLFGGARSPLALANIFIAGLFFGLLLLRTGTLAAPIAAHFAWNWAETNLFGLAPNPGVSVYGSLFDFDLSGASYWGGSDEGLNAAFAVTVALTAAILPLLAWRRTEAPGRNQPA